MAKFDLVNANQLSNEHKMLAAGSGVQADISVPAIYERTVIREFLYQMTGLSFVNSSVINFANSWVAPFSYRDATAAGRQSTRVYEGQAIENAGIKQESETAYPIPQKLSFEFTKELQLLSDAGHIDFDIIAENAGNAARIIAEDTDSLIYNEIVQSADEYASVAIAAETTLTADFDGSNTIFQLNNFPVCRPRKIFDLTGSQIGSTINPIVVTYDSVLRLEYNGTGTQASGIYYILDYNIGEIKLVSEAGVLVAPATGKTCPISYSYSTNVAKFDTDLGSLAVDAKYDQLLYLIGLRKSVIEDRLSVCDFGLTVSSVINAIEQARQFSANYTRPGTDLDATGNLGQIKSIPFFKTIAPGIWLGSNRIMMGERYTTRFRMMKPWSLNPLEEQKDSSGKFTGKQHAYGDQWLGLHTPSPLKKNSTSIVLYSATTRVAR